MLKVIGLGNILRGDDGIGPLVLEKLGEQADPSLQLIDAGSDAFILLEHLIGTYPLLVVDCAQLNKQPGSICMFNVSDARLRENIASVSLHNFGFAGILRLAREIGPVASCKIIGVQPKTIAFNEQLSDEVRASIPKIIELINQEMKSYV